MSRPEFVSSFVVARGQLESSPRGHDDLHILLAEALSERFGAEVRVGDYASGVLLLTESKPIARLNRLPLGVAEAVVLRLLNKEFGDLGEVALDIISSRMQGEVDRTWPWEWRDGCHGRALLAEPCNQTARLFSWCFEDQDVPVMHAEAMKLLSLSDAVCLVIDPGGTCDAYFVDDNPGLRECVSAALPRLDPRLCLRDPNEHESKYPDTFGYHA